MFQWANSLLEILWYQNKGSYKTGHFQHLLLNTLGSQAIEKPGKLCRTAFLALWLAGTWESVRTLQRIFPNNYLGVGSDTEEDKYLLRG